MARTANDINDMLVQLEDGVQRIMSYPPETLDLQTYLRLYTLIHNYCVKLKTDGHGRGAHLRGEELYLWLDGYLKRHLLALHTEMVSQSDDDLVTFYLERWRCYKAAAIHNTHLFRFLDRHWVKREVDEAKQEVYHIYPLHLLRWKKDILENTENPVRGMLEQQIESAEDDVLVVLPNVPEVLESFASAGISIGSST